MGINERGIVNIYPFFYPFQAIKYAQITTINLLLYIVLSLY